MNIALIPARGGSKRILKKNSKIFFGNPIIFYPIKVLINSKLFDKIFVTSDDENLISYINKNFPHIKTIKRKKKLSSDNVKTITVVKNFIKNDLKIKNVKIICCVYPTTPLLNVENLKLGLKICKKFRNFVFPVLKSNFTSGKFIKLKSNTIEKVLTKNDNFTVNYQDSGQFYWGTLGNWLKKKKIIDKSSKCFAVGDQDAIDINTNEDWNKAKKLFKKKMNKST